MATAAQVSVETYLDTAYDPDVDYIDGEIEERCVGEGRHSSWQGAIYFWFRLHAEEWRICVRPEMRVQVSAANYLVADDAILEAAQADVQIAVEPPVAVFEVLSRRDYHKRLLRKLALYAAMGVPAIYSLDPDTGEFSRFEDGQLVRRARFELPERGIEFAFEEIAKLVL